MSNVLNIDTTEFKRQGYTSYGLCIYDDFERQYCSYLSREEFEKLETDDRGMFELAEKEFPSFFFNISVFGGIQVNGVEISEECKKCKDRFLYWEKQHKTFADPLGGGLMEYDVCPHCKYQLNMKALNQYGE